MIHTDDNAHAPPSGPDSPTPAKFFKNSPKTQPPEIVKKHTDDPTETQTSQKKEKTHSSDKAKSKSAGSKRRFSETAPDKNEKNEKNDKIDENNKNDKKDKKDQIDRKDKHDKKDKTDKTDKTDKNDQIAKNDKTHKKRKSEPGPTNREAELSRLTADEANYRFKNDDELQV